MQSVASVQSVAQVLAGRPYPGRGCLAARTRDGRLCLVSFLTGRSAASRGRDLRLLPNGDVTVQDTTGSGEHDALRHYVAGARRGTWVVVGNGDHVVPLAEALSAGVPVTTAWQEHTFEPDPPVHTSRIWTARRIDGPHDCLLGYARRSTRGDGDVDRVVWLAGTLAPGTGILMTTYDGTIATVHANPAPDDVQTDSDTMDDLLQEVWSELDPQLRVAAFAVAADEEQATTLTIR